ncbi:carboxypeptidase-like regulatory domain-containing protein [Acidicapsa dinghuensis]|uniref:Carboxypeptidase-like regulatory domain-containing protein n=1 Tax=Acidicapsa dinghuensis TaxID=2218256 RepID=A0ABW1EPY2_9BACT|nr:carboxypeptidase-like regulatory domain-containing protein [Acidicapsa dinghuensis]
MLKGQVFELSGGNSSLYQAGGGALSIHAPDTEFTLGAGTVDGHLLEGARMLRSTPHGTYIAGDERLDFRLPTDIFDTSHYLQLRGLGYRSQHLGTDMTLFAGGLSLDYSSPLFDGAKLDAPAGVLFLRKSLNPHWQIFSDTVVSSKSTQIEALQWTPTPKIEVAASAGMGANQLFGAASINMSRKLFDLKAAYIAAGNEFHRITVPSPLLAEPDRENILAVFKPWKFLTLTGSHQNFLVPQYPNPTDLRSSIDQGSASIHFFDTQLGATLYRSTYTPVPNEEESNHAAALSATRNFGERLRINAEYLASHSPGTAAQSTFFSTLTETLTARISVNESITYSDGHTGINFGGEFLSNRLSFSSSYETFYIPANNTNPFEQVLLLDVKLRMMGRLLLHGATFVDPTGHLRYTADANSVYSRSMASSEQHEAPLGKFILQGCVVDEHGSPVEGAAVLIDEAPVYTDSGGCFSMRENHQHTHHLRVVLSQFLIGGNWQITSAPSTITSVPEEQSGQSTVVVSVRKVREVSSNGTKSTQPATGNERQ